MLYDELGNQLRQSVGFVNSVVWEQCSKYSV